MAWPRGWPLLVLGAGALPLACSSVLGIHDIEPPSDAGHKDGSAGDAHADAHDGSRDGAADATRQDSSDDVTTDTATTEASDGPPAACSEDAGQGALGLPGCPCSPVGALACDGHAQPVTLICGASGVWAPSSTCPGGDLCDSRPGPAQGTCTAIDPLCTGLMPGADVCSDNVTIAQCGPDLVSHSDLGTCTDQACVAGACTGMCTPFTTQTCVTYTSISTCSSAGTWETIFCTDPRPDCTYVAGSGGQIVASCDCLGDIVVGHCVEPVNLYGPTNGGWHVAVDPTSVYWSEVPSVSCDGGTCSPNSDGTIKKVLLGGGNPTTLVSGLGNATGFRINATGLYWVAPSCPADGGTCTDTLWSEPLGGGTATAIGPVPRAVDFVVDATNAYVSITTTSIVQVPLDGSPPTTLASSAFPENVAVDSANVYFTDYTRGSVFRVPIGGGGAVPLASSTRGSYVAVDPSRLELFDPNCPDAGTCFSLLSVPLAGGPTSVLATPSGDSPLALYGGNVYFNDQFDILSVPLGGGAVSRLATPRGSVHDIAVDATNIYYVDMGGYGVWKLPRP